MEKTDTISIKIYVNKIKNRIKFKIRTGYYLKILKSEAMKLLESKIGILNKDKNGKNMPNLEAIEIVLVHCNIVKNDHQQDSRVLYTFIPNKSFGQLLDFSPKSFIFLILTVHSEFSLSYIEV